MIEANGRLPEQINIKEKILMANLSEVNASNFDSEVLKSNIPVLVDFWAPWCGPCRMVAPVVETVANDVKGKMKVVKLNTDESPQIAAQYQIMGIPTLMFFKGGKMADRITGYLPKEALLQKANSIINAK